jgi:uncharacterized protein
MADPQTARPLAVVTGASTGIGLAIARELARRGHDLVVAADEDRIRTVATELEGEGIAAEPVQVDLATAEGVERLAAAATSGGRAVDVLVLNAGVGVNGPFVDTDLDDHLRVVALNVTSTVQLAGLLLPAMAERGEGRVLFTASIAAAMAGPEMSTYNASKTFVQSFGEAVRQELADRGVTVTILRPGGTDTEFFARADMEDTKLGQAKKDDPAQVGVEAVEALLDGKAEIVSGGLKNRVLETASKVLPDGLIGSAHEAFVTPGGAKDDE